jgi:hypothetical protein
LQSRQDSKLFTIIAVSAAANAAATFAAAATENLLLQLQIQLLKRLIIPLTIDKFQSVRPLKKQIFSCQNFDPKTGGICNQLTHN